MELGALGSNSGCSDNINRSGSPNSQDSGKGHKSHGHHFHLPHLGKMHHSLHLPHFPLHLSFRKGEEFYKDVPKGCLAVYVGQGEQQQRFIIPVVYINHPLFEKLLKEAEEEYGFEQKGTITIPCQVSVFQYVQDLIDREQHESHGHGGCFR